MHDKNDFDYAYLAYLKNNHSAVKLLSADSAPLILGFLHSVFTHGNRDSITHSDIISRLSDYLYTINSAFGENTYPRTPKQYLDSWAGEGYLRKYYSGLDEQLYEPTPAVSKVFEWIHGLTQRQFVGTESRLLTIFSLLKNMVTQTLQDPIEMVNELEKQKAEIQARIDRIKRGEMEPYDPTRIKEQFYQVEDTVRQLIGDFRQIDKNFRDLNQETKQIIATSDLSKGRLLDRVFGGHDLIWDTDQGKSFKAFWELMLSPEMQEELDESLQYIYSLQEIKELEPQPLVLKTRLMLLDAGGRVYRSNSKLAEQLRRYLDNKMYLENRRIMDLMRPIEEKALCLREEEVPRRACFMDISEIGVAFDLVMTQKLFVVPTIPIVASDGIEVGKGEENDALLLFKQQFIDRDALKGNILSALRRQAQISLSHLLDEFPLEHGVAEIVTYFDIAHVSRRHIIDTETKDDILVRRPDGSTQVVTMYRVIFIR